MVSIMNSGHAAMAQWGFEHILIPKNANVLDTGCGGGANIKKMLELCPEGTLKGIDCSEVSANKSRKVNAKAIRDGRCEVLQASAAELPFAENTFDVVTAFETVYFWPDLEQCFGQVLRVLKAGG